MAEEPNMALLQKRVANDLIRLEEELKAKRAEATAGGGLVRVRVDGHQQLRELVIDPMAFEGRDPELLADLIMSAVTEAQRRVEAMEDKTQLTALDPEVAGG